MFNDPVVIDHVDFGYALEGMLHMALLACACFLHIVWL